MPDLIVIAALDSFGVDVARRAQCLDPALGDDADLLWVWAGDGERPDPGPSRYFGPLAWSYALEEDGPLCIDHEKPVDEQFDRRHYFESILPSARENLRKWNGERETAHRSPDDRHTHVFFAGSLADPRSALRALAYFRAYTDDETLWGEWRFASVMALGRNTASLQIRAAHGSELIHDAATAVSLRDLQRHVEAVARREKEHWLPFLPVILVGNGRHFSSPMPTYADAVFLGGLSLLGLLYNVRQTVSENSMFGMKRLNGKQAQWNTHNFFDPGKPFCAVGAAALALRRPQLLEALAVVSTALLLKPYSTQPEPGPEWGPAIETANPQTAELLVNSRDEVLMDISRLLGRCGFPGEGAYTQRFSPDVLDGLAGWRSLFAGWHKRLEAAYGWPSFRKEPREDWEQALQELQHVADKFFRGDRDRILDEFTAAVAQGLDKAITSAVDRVCADSWKTDFPAPFQPHLVSRHLMASLEKEFAAQEQANGEQVKDRRNALSDDQSYAQFPAKIKAAYRVIIDKVRRIPSPLAVMARLVSWWALVLFLFQVVTFSWYARYSAETVFWIRLGLGAGISLLLTFYYVQRAFRLKKELKDTYEEWFNLQIEYYKEQTEREFLRRREEIYQVTRDYFQWLRLNPKKAAWKPFHKFSAVAGAVSRSWIRDAEKSEADRSLHRFLHSYHEDFEEAKSRYETLLGNLCLKFSECRHEIILPQIPRGNHGKPTRPATLSGPARSAHPGIRKLAVLAGGVLPGLASPRPEEVIPAARGLFEAILGATTVLPLQSLPFLEATRSRDSEPMVWKGCYRWPLLPPESLPGAVDSNDLFEATIATLAEYLRKNVGEFSRTLNLWILEDFYGASSWGEVRDFHNAQWNHLTEVKQPPLSLPGTARSLRHEVWSGDRNKFTESLDPAANAETVALSLKDSPERAFTAALTMVTGLCAEDVIYGSTTAANPDNIIGRSWEKEKGRVRPINILLGI